MKIVFIVHYFPPLNSTGSKRMEAMAKYLSRKGHQVTVITSRKTAADGALTEAPPPGARVLEIDWRGRLASSMPAGTAAAKIPDAKNSSAAAKAAAPSLQLRLKRHVQRWMGQLPDLRLPFAFAFSSPALAGEVRQALREADVAVASMPPWPTHLACLLVRRRFGVPMVLDYRDQFSENHIMAGSVPAKWLESRVDGYLARQADAVVAISEPMAEYYRRFNPRSHVILNGYDPEIIDEVRVSLPATAPAEGQPITLRYLGRMSRDRIPVPLLAALKRLHEAAAVRPDQLRLEFYGECEQLAALVQSLHPALLPYFSFSASVPYRSALQLMLTADYLLFSETSDQSSLSARGVLTTKLFEYLACERPIVAAIDAGTEAGRLIRRGGECHLVSTDVSDFEAFLKSAVKRGRAGGLSAPWVRQLSREAQADQYAALLASVLR